MNFFRLSLLMVVAVLLLHKAGHARTRPGRINSDTTLHFQVAGVCDQCKHRIETAAKGKGVTAASWDMDSHLLTLSFDPSHTSLDKIVSRITASGHDNQFR